MQTAPRRAPPDVRAVSPAFVTALVLAWLLAWAVLWASASAAGGRPTTGPLQLVDPGFLVGVFRRDRGVVAWHLVGASGAVNAAMFWAAVAAQSTLVTGAAALAGRGVRRRRGGSSSGRSGRSGVRHSSHWATRRDVRPLRTRAAQPGRIALGRQGSTLLAAERETSVLVIGPTRSGKTSGLVIPNVLEWEGPAIVTSTKSEIVDVTAGHRQRVGPVFVYDPTGEIGDRYRGVTWSPLAGCDDLDHAWRVASWLCAAMQSGSARSDNDWAHWAESAKLLVAPLLFAAATGSRRSIADVRDWVLAVDVETPLALLHALRDAAPASSDGDVERAITWLTSVDRRPEKERGTVFSTLSRVFTTFSERAVTASALSSRFDPHQLLLQRGTLYLCTPRDAPERVASLFVGILMTVVTRAYALAAASPRGRLVPELGLFLDELANVVPIEDLPSLASQGAGRGVTLLAVVQDLSQLRARYGVDRCNSIVNNHPCKVVLPGLSDPETCEQVARLVGRADYTDVSVSRGRGGVSRSYSVRQEPMATPDALRQLPVGSAIVLDRGRPPVMVQLRPWWRDRRLRSRAERRHFRVADHVSTGPAGRRPGALRRDPQR